LKLIVHVAGTPNGDHRSELARRDVVDLEDSRRVESVFENYAKEP
jgi:hypothetical protein